MDSFNQGRVIIMGAGPGDPELLTLKAERWLRQADVVLYDFLVHPSLLTICKDDTQLICVGKRKGMHQSGQDDINQMLLDYAKSGQLVVRLKGGDPFVFGRGGEEVGVLRRHNIAVEVVPGVSALSAVPAYSGIPLTYRQMARSVALFSGSLSDGEPPHALHLPVADTVVGFMAVTHLKSIIERYLSRGVFSAHTPAAVIYKGTLAAQRSIFSTLGQISADLVASEMGSPALLVIGDVVSLANELNWTQYLPLFGERVWVLRAAHQSQGLTRQLRSLGAEVIPAPVLKFEPCEALKQLSAEYLSAFSMVIFTSSNGVRYFMKQLLSLGLDARCLSGKQLVAVGPNTAAILLEFGIVADFQPDDYHSEAIALGLANRLVAQRILMPVASGADPNFPELLKQQGAQVEVLPIYNTIQPDQTDWDVETGDWIILTSPSSANHFFRSVEYRNRDLRLVSIGKKTSLAIRVYWQGDIIESKSAEETGLVSAILLAKGAS